MSGAGGSDPPAPRVTLEPAGLRQFRHLGGRFTRPA